MKVDKVGLCVRIGLRIARAAAWLVVSAVLLYGLWVCAEWLTWERVKFAVTFVWMVLVFSYEAAWDYVGLWAIALVPLVGTIWLWFPICICAFKLALYGAMLFVGWGALVYAKDELLGWAE
ncbi:MAG: hypothetical protein ACE366_02790 [Bradymonadia bacterium]